MTSRESTYAALRQCAKRRIEEEWDLTGREQQVCRVIEECSFGMQQRVACIPTQALLATACGLHRSDVCRALKSLIKKGALSMRSHRDETLYQLELHCSSVPRKTVVTDRERDAAMAQLKLIQERRGGGEADATGQGRLYGVLGPREDQRVESEAFQAMMEEPAPATRENAPEALQEPPAAIRRADEPELDPEELAAGLADLRARLAEPGIPAGPLAPLQERVWAPPPPSVVQDMRLRPLEKHRAGLEGKYLELWDRLVVEVLRGSSRGWHEFVTYAPAWRKRVLNHFHEVHEAVSDHKLKNNGPAEKPAAWIWSRMKAKT